MASLGLGCQSYETPGSNSRMAGCSGACIIHPSLDPEALTQLEAPCSNAETRRFGVEEAGKGSGRNGPRKYAGIVASQKRRSFIWKKKTGVFLDFSSVCSRPFSSFPSSEFTYHSSPTTKHRDTGSYFQEYCSVHRGQPHSQLHLYRATHHAPRHTMAPGVLKLWGLGLLVASSAVAEEPAQEQQQQQQSQSSDAEAKWSAYEHVSPNDLNKLLKERPHNLVACEQHLPHFLPSVRKEANVIAVIDVCSPLPPLSHVSLC